MADVRPRGAGAATRPLRLNQWLAVLEELGGLQGVHPIPNSFPQGEENSKFSYSFLSTNIATEVNGQANSSQGRWSSGESIDGKGEFSFEKAMPFGDKPNLAPAKPEGFAQTEQMKDDDNFIKSVFKNL